MYVNLCFSGYLYGHVSYLADDCEACLLLLSVDREQFFTLSEAKQKIVDVSCKLCFCHTPFSLSVTVLSVSANYYGCIFLLASNIQWFDGFVFHTEAEETPLLRGDQHSHTDISLHCGGCWGTWAKTFPLQVKNHSTVHLPRVHCPVCPLLLFSFKSSWLYFDFFSDMHNNISVEINPFVKEKWGSEHSSYSSLPVTVCKEYCKISLNSLHSILWFAGLRARRLALIWLNTGLLWFRYNTPEQQRQLFGLYQQLHHRVHSVSRPLKMVYMVMDTHTLLGWVSGSHSSSLKFTDLIVPLCLEVHTVWCRNQNSIVWGTSGLHSEHFFSGNEGVWVVCDTGASSHQTQCHCIYKQASQVDQEWREQIVYPKLPHILTCINILYIFQYCTNVISFSFFFLLFLICDI